MIVELNLFPEIIFFLKDVIIMLENYRFLRKMISEKKLNFTIKSRNE